MKNKIKKVILIKLLPFIAAGLFCLFLIATIAAVTAEHTTQAAGDAAYQTEKHEEEMDDLLWEIEEFDIRGSRTGDEYTLKFEFTWGDINNIKFKLKDGKANLKTNVTMPIRNSNFAEGCVKWAKRTSVFYCHPRSPQERGSNEVQNQLIRRWYPKGSDFDQLLNRTDVKDLEWWINTYPRRMFSGDNSQERFNAELIKLGCRLPA